MSDDQQKVPQAPLANVSALEALRTIIQLSVLGIRDLNQRVTHVDEVRADRG
ncbi:MAG: hypothetical protein AAFX06_04110 [Planctomycetota bacterium]